MKILIVGLGSIARKHIVATLTVDPAAEFYALRSNMNAQILDNVVNIFSKDEAERIEVDFAIISNPTSEHAKTIEWLVELKIPLFIEKPLSNNLDLDNVIYKCESLLTYVACNLRFLDCLQWVAENIENKRINEVNAYCGSYLPEWRQGIDWRKCYSANSVMGGGVHIDLIHEIDYVYWLFGKPITVQKILKKSSSLDIDAIDYANYCLIYPTFAASVILNYYRRDYKRTLELVLQDETWEIDLARNMVYCSGKVLFEGKNGFADTYQRQMEYFISLVEARAKQSMNSITEAYDVLKICLKNEIK